MCTYYYSLFMLYDASVPHSGQFWFLLWQQCTWSVCWQCLYIESLLTLLFDMCLYTGKWTVLKRMRWNRRKGRSRWYLMLFLNGKRDSCGRKSPNKMHYYSYTTLGLHLTLCILAFLELHFGMAILAGKLVGTRTSACARAWLRPWLQLLRQQNASRSYVLRVHAGLTH